MITGFEGYVRVTPAVTVIKKIVTRMGRPFWMGFGLGPALKTKSRNFEYLPWRFQIVQQPGKL